MIENCTPDRRAEGRVVPGTLARVGRCVAGFAALAAALAGVNEIDTATEVATEALVALERIFGEGHPATSECLMVLAHIELRKRNLSRAMSYAHRVRAQTLDTLGVHPYTAGTSSFVALIATEQGDNATALAMLRDAMRMHAESLTATEATRNAHEAAIRRLCTEKNYKPACEGN